MAKATQPVNEAPAIAVGVVAYKGRQLAYRWPASNTMVVALLAHQGYITPAQLQALVPTNASPKAWLRWLTTIGGNNSRANQKLPGVGGVLTSHLGVADCIVLAQGASPLPWLVSGPVAGMFASALALAPTAPAVAPKPAGKAKGSKPAPKPAVAPVSAAVALPVGEVEAQPVIELGTYGHPLANG